VLATDNAELAVASLPVTWSSSGHGPLNAHLPPPPPLTDNYPGGHASSSRCPRCRRVRGNPPESLLLLQPPPPLLQETSRVISLGGPRGPRRVRRQFVTRRNRPSTQNATRHDVITGNISGSSSSSSGGGGGGGFSRLSLSAAP